jgi:hypothetical protein
MSSSLSSADPAKVVAEFLHALELKDLIIREMTTALKHLGAKSDLLGWACSYGETLTDRQVLSGLREWNSFGPVKSTERVSPD